MRSDSGSYTCTCLCSVHRVCWRLDPVCPGEIRLYLLPVCAELWGQNRRPASSPSSHSFLHIVPHTGRGTPVRPERFTRQMSFSRSASSVPARSADPGENVEEPARANPQKPAGSPAGSGDELTVDQGSSDGGPGSLLGARPDSEPSQRLTYLFS